MCKENVDLTIKYLKNKKQFFRFIPNEYYVGFKYKMYLKIKIQLLKVIAVRGRKTFKCKHKKSMEKMEKFIKLFKYVLILDCYMKAFSKIISQINFKTLKK